jgi:hypothetical protein
VPPMIEPIAAPTPDLGPVTIEDLDASLIKSDASFVKIIAQPKRTRIKEMGNIGGEGEHNQKNLTLEGTVNDQARHEKNCQILTRQRPAPISASRSER